MSMKDMNIAKLTSADLPLFNGIIQDLFPAVETPTIDYGKVGHMHGQYCSPPIRFSAGLSSLVSKQTPVHHGTNAHLYYRSKGRFDCAGIS